MDLKNFRGEFEKTSEGQVYERLIRQRFEQYNNYVKSERIVKVKKNKLKNLGYFV